MEDLPLYDETCTECSLTYKVTTVDRYFLNKFACPEPKRCPHCRERRRLLFLNMMNLFRRTCDATGASIVSSYPPDSPYKVFSQKYWYSEQFDATKFGRSFDFSRPFFDQFGELSREVPRPALFTGFLHDENCDFTNHSALNKDCYMVFDTTMCRNVYYSYGIEDARDSMECHRSNGIELCYEVIDSVQCYQSLFLQNCQGCRDSALLLNCISCTNCLLCVNLRHKQFHIFNKPVSPEEFYRVRALLEDQQSLGQLLEQFRLFALQFPRKYVEGMNNEQVTGDYLVRCKNTFSSFDCRTIEEGKYCTQSFLKSKDSYCTRELGDGELFYESANSGGGYNLRFCWNCFQSVHDITYSDYCVNGAHALFGCVGIKGKGFCILNKEYSEAEYYPLVDAIIQHMKKTGEWGQQPPASLTPFEYNISEAQHRYPLSESEILKAGFRYRAPDSKEYLPPTASIPLKISEASDTVAKELYSCASCNKNYKIITQELALYRELRVALPTQCFQCRNKARHHQRNPRSLYERACAHCHIPLISSYAQEREEIILCEKCFADALA